MADPRDVDALHHPWCLPFELVDLSPHEAEPSWAVVMEDGNVLRPAGPFAPAIVARVRGGEHVLPTRPWAREAARAFLDAQLEEEGAWLIRLAKPGAGTPDCLLLRGPEAARPRPIQEGPVALLMDFGKVLCDFDYGWFVWSHAAVFGAEPSPDCLLEVEQLRPRFEAGDIDEARFYAFCAERFGLLEADRSLFAAAWSNILRPQHDMIAWLGRARRQPGWTSVMVSNIDPILVREAVPRLGLGELFEAGVYSYLPEVRPKQEDGSMWRLAAERCTARLGVAPALTVATDDTPLNLLTAAAEPGVDATIRFHNAAQWVYELGCHGAYLPRSR